MTKLIAYHQLDEKFNPKSIKLKAKGIVLELHFRRMLNKHIIPYNQAGPFYKLFANALEFHNNEEWAKLEITLSTIKTKLEPFTKEFKLRH